MAQKPRKQHSSRKIIRGVVNNKPSRSPEGNEPKNSTDGHKRQAPNTKRYQDKKTQTKTQGPELEAKTNFKVDSPT